VIRAPNHLPKITLGFFDVFGKLSSLGLVQIEVLGFCIDSLPSQKPARLFAESLAHLVSYACEILFWEVIGVVEVESTVNVSHPGER